jgi:glycosyltransferase involved in cell wall biosynthesis
MSVKLLQISFGDGYAGSAKIAILSSDLLSKRNYDVTLVVSKNSLTEQRARERGMKVISIDTTQKFKSIFNENDQLFTALKPQVIISHHSLDRKVGMKLTRKYRHQFLNIGYRHNVTKSTPIIGPFLYNRFFDHLIACSNGVANSLISSGIKKDKIQVIYNGISIPTNINEINGELVRNNYNLRGKIVLGLSTWFHKERKGFDILFNSFSRLDDKFNLLLVGIPESDKQNVLDYAKEFNIPKEKLIMPGYVDNIWEYYKAMDIFLLPSRSEGFSLALLEAAAANLPIIATNIPGTNEFIINGENGILFEPEQPDELLNEIIKLTGDKQLAEKFALNAYEKVLNNFTNDNYVADLDNFLVSALKYV